MSDQIRLDRERCEELTVALSAQVNAFYRALGGAQQQYVYEVLNALAVSTAFVIAGTAPDGVRDCLHFFSDAITTQLNDTLAAMREGRLKPEGLH